MLYSINAETFKIVKENNVFKLYHKAENKWSSGWTFVGKYQNADKAQTAARLYTN